MQTIYRDEQCRGITLQHDTMPSGFWEKPGLFMNPTDPAVRISSEDADKPSFRKSGGALVLPSYPRDRKSVV